jgi:hypothetical protein
MGTVATATSAPVAVGIGATVCALYAGVLLVRRVGSGQTSGAQPEIEPPR